MKDKRLSDAIIQLECQQLLNRISLLTDHQDWQALALCYTQDAVLTRPSEPEKPIRGREEILASLQARSPRSTAHLNSGAVFTLIGCDEVHSVSRVWLLSGPPPIDAKPVVADGKLLIGTFTDILARQDGHWLIAQRQGSIEIQSPLE